MMRIGEKSNQEKSDTSMEETPEVERSSSPAIIPHRSYARVVEGEASETDSNSGDEEVVYAVNGRSNYQSIPIDDHILDSSSSSSSSWTLSSSWATSSTSTQIVGDTRYAESFVSVDLNDETQPLLGSRNEGRFIGSFVWGLFSGVGVGEGEEKMNGGKGDTHPHTHSLSHTHTRSTREREQER